VVRPALEDSLPSLANIASGTSDEGAAGREPSTTDEADGIVVQVEFNFNSLAPFRNTNTVNAMTAALRTLVLGLGLPSTATVRVVFTISGDVLATRRGLSVHGSQHRLLQSVEPKAFASIAIDLNDTASVTDSLSSAASISAATNLANTVTTQLADNTANLATVVHTAIIETDPSSSDVTIGVAQPPLFAVIASSDGAVIAASASVISVVRPTPSPTPSPSPAAPGTGGAITDDGFGIGAVVLGGCVLGVLVIAAGYLVCRTRNGGKRDVASTSGGAVDW
jgi:hypothetical protein